MRRLLANILMVVVLFAAAAAGGAYLYLRRSLPTIDATIVVAGLSAPVEIVRDADAVPHVMAATKRDALFGLGYVHAQDRLWQMEFQRRIGFGRLSEIFGAVTVPQDRFLRTVGFGRAARSAWERMPAWSREQVEAYVAGVNAFIAAHHGARLPPEFTLLRYEPEPFSGPDVVVWVKMMAWDLAANYSFELLRDDLVRAVGPARMVELMPPYPAGGLSVVGGRSNGTVESAARERTGTPAATHADRGTPPRSGTVRPASGVASLVRALSTGDRTVGDFLLGNTSGEALGSNNWVIDGTLSASGRPLLANDPHLSSKTPSTWYLVHVSGGGFDVVGATLPGTPAVAIGRNRRIAWGETNVAADVQDLFRERLDPTGRFAEFGGAQEPVAFVTETIGVKGGTPVRVDVRITRHGPLISDAINAINEESAAAPRAATLEPLALRWTALDDEDTTLESFLRLNESRNWEEFTGALRAFVGPSQNFVYGDVDGHIGYYAPGRIPLRARGDGSRPAEGWTGDAEWTGWVPFDDLPHAYDPPEHFIVTANNRPMPADYAYNLGAEWAEPYRAGRIVDLLGRHARLGPDDFARIQADTQSPHAAVLLPMLLRHVRGAVGADARAANMLERWNGNQAGDSAEAAIFNAWFHQLLPAIAGDELGPAALDSYDGRLTYVARFLGNVLAPDDSPWCDDVRTERRETCDEAVTAALHAGVADLTARLGGALDSWRWDGAHRAMFPHQGLDAVAMLRPLLSRSAPHGGDWSTVNVGPVAADHPYEQRSVAGYRQIVDLSPANDSRFLDALGESGHFLSPHYDDFLADWRAVRHRKMRMDRSEIEAGAIGRLRLQPAR